MSIHVVMTITEVCKFSRGYLVKAEVEAEELFVDSVKFAITKDELLRFPVASQVTVSIDPITSE